MSASCGHHQDFDGSAPGFRRALWAVIAINAAMFAVEMLAGAAARSQALKADALDFAADAATYGLSLYVIGKPARWRAARSCSRPRSRRKRRSQVPPRSTSRRRLKTWTALYA